MNIKNNLLIYDLTPSVKYTRISQSGNDTTFKHFLGNSTSFIFETLDATPSAVQSLLLSSTQVTIPINLSVTGTSTLSNSSFTGTSNFTTAIPTCSLNASSNNQLVNWQTLNGQSFTTLAAVQANTNTFSSANTFSAATNISSDLTLRSTKLYNKVKVITATGSLSFPLEETIVINTTSNITITLPTITANSLGMTFYFLKNETSSFTTFTGSSTDTIVLNGSKIGSTTKVVMNKGQTSCQLTCLQYFVGAVNNWVEIVTSLPKQISNPPGSILTMAVGTLPEGYLACNGTTHSVLTYPDLYAVIGNTFGGTSGATFTTPYYNNYSAFLRGQGVDALAYGTLQNSNIKTHKHDILFGYDNNIQGSGGSGTCYNSTGPSYNNPGPSTGLTSTGITENNTAGSVDDTYPINFAVFYAIKY